MLNRPRPKMQALLRSSTSTLKTEDVNMFVDLFTSGKLVKPSDAGYVIASLSISAGKELSGQANVDAAVPSCIVWSPLGGCRSSLSLSGGRDLRLLEHFGDVTNLKRSDRKQQEPIQFFQNLAMTYTQSPPVTALLERPCGWVTLR
ncbi:hypothetical protein FRC17_003769, partial [Serendipita sp. 399]